MLRWILFTLAVTNVNAGAAEPVIPSAQVCKIAYGIRSDGDNFKRFALCLGALVGDPSEEHSSWLLTAGHCSPANMFASFQNHVLNMPAAIREPWEERIHAGKLAVQIECDGVQSWAPSPKAVVHPGYASVSLWLWKKMMHKEAGPYPIDLALLRLDKPIAVSPLAFSAATKEDVLKNKDNCLITTFTSDYRRMLFHSGRPLFEEEPFPLFAVQETQPPLLNDGDSGGPLLCREGGAYRIAGVNSLSFLGLQSSFIQNFSPDIQQWLKSLLQSSSQTTGQAR